MPNHCQNKLIIACKTSEELEEIIKHLETNEQELSFANIAPPPLEDPAYRDEPNQAEAKASPNWWYNWNVENWGTKWDCYSVRLTIPNYDPKWQLPHVVYRFETAWSPPNTNLISYLSHLFPHATVCNWWCETGMNFAGHGVYRAGEQEEFAEYKPPVRTSDLVWKATEQHPPRIFAPPQEDEEAGDDN
jgi:hypothetical protein